MFVNLAQSDMGFADLDAITAALEQTGGGAADSLVALGTFLIIGDVFTGAE